MNSNSPAPGWLIAASAALTISGVPFMGPIGAARVGYQNGEYILNPNQTQLKEGDLDLVVAGTHNAVMMVESEANELSEDVMLGAVMFAHRASAKVVEGIIKLAEQAAKEPWELDMVEDKAGAKDKLKSLIGKDLEAAYKLTDKQARQTAINEARAKARAESERAEYEGKVAARAERQGSAKGPEPKPPRDTPEPDEQINLTDPDARLMRKSKRESYTQSYNAQAVVDIDGSQLIVGQRVSTCAADVGETEADLASIPASLGTPTVALADCGYADREVIARLGRERPEMEFYVSVHREDAHAERRYDWRPLDKIKAPKTIIDPVLVAMAEKLQTPEGKATYRRRACTVEAVFGIIKAALGFRQFMLRGLEKVSGEWNLVCLAYNFKRLHTLRLAAVAS